MLKLGLVDTIPLNRRQAVTATGAACLDPQAVQLVEAALKDNDSLLDPLTSA